MELKHLTTFLAVARHLNFTRASHELGYVQSSVTAHVKALEVDLGVPLFERLGRRVALTDAGRELRQHAQALLSHAEQTRDAVRSAGDDSRDIRGTLRIAAPESLCAHHVPPVLGALRERFPRLRVVFGPADRVPLLTALVEGTLDMGFVLEESVDVPGVHAVPLTREPLCLVAAPGHPLVSYGKVDTPDLAEETVLLIERGCAQRSVMDRELLRFGLHPMTMEFVSVEPLKRCAAAGLGVAVVPTASVSDEVARGELTALPWVREPTLDVFAVRHKNRRPTRVLQELTAIAHERWGTGPGPGA